MAKRWLASWLLAMACAAPAHAQTVEYIHTDALGTPVAVTDANGNVIERSEYEPYGALLNKPITDGPGYTGHVMDAATGLVYMQQRYYDPIIGRFLSIDPVTANGNTGGNFNRYWYANNNPYKFTDPDGRCPTIAGSHIRSCGADSVLGGTRSVGPIGDIGSSGSSGKSNPQASSSSNPAPTKANSAQDGREGLNGASVFTGDKKITFTGVAALGSGIKAEKVTGPGNDKVSFVTPALGLSAAATVNLGTIRYDWGGPGSAFDAGVSGGGIRGGLGFAGGLQLSVDSQGVELQLSGGLGAGVSVDLYGIGYKPGAD